MVHLLVLSNANEQCFQFILVINPLAPELFFLILAHLYIKCE